MSKTITNKLGTMLMSIVLLLSLIPSVAFASVFDDITKEYRYMDSEGYEIPEQITQEGNTYTLVSKTEAIVDPNWERPSKNVSTTETKSIPAKDLNRAANYFDSEKPYSDEEGFEGIMTIANIATTPEYEVLTRQVDRTYTFTGLPNNDLSQIPATKSFTVSSGSAPGATTTKTLSMSDCEFVVESYNASGLPESYAAHVDYRGQEEYVTIPGYTAVATYKATAELVDTQMLITATYAWIFPWWGVVAAAVLAAGATAAVARFVYVFFWRKKRAIVWRIEGDDETLLERVKVVQTDKDQYRIDIPGDIRIDEMTESRHYEVQIPEKYLNHSIRIVQNELVVFDDVANHLRIRVLNPFD